MTVVMPNTDDRSFMGHPKALAFISFTEAWERFSYYGMTALLALYMSKQLLQPGHIEHVLGMDATRWFLNHTYGHGQVLSVLGLGSAIFGFYSSTVYLTPIFGGLLADYVLGRTKTVILGACLMALGHFLMAFDQSFLIALTCLMLGAGCLKGNLATQVGSLYPVGDLRRAAVEGFEQQKLRIDAQIAELQAMLTGTPTNPAATPESPKAKRRMSAAARKRIGDAQRKRWAQSKKTFSPVESEAPKPKRKLSAAGKKAIVEATRKRWAAFHAAKKAETPTDARKRAAKEMATKKVPVMPSRKATKNVAAKRPQKAATTPAAVPAAAQ